MGFFNRGDGEDREQDESLERIESGGIPLGAEQRLRDLGAEGSMFTSSLSVKEFALLRQMGPQPIAQVMGASVVRTGYQYLPALPAGEIISGGSGRAYYNTQPAGYVNRFTEPSVWQIRNYNWHTTEICELDILSQAWRTARRRALDRLSEEALHVNADVVVGVRLHRSDHDLGRGTIEYVVTGTAIRLPGSTATNVPVLTDLSVQDYWRLHEAGQEPVGFLATTAVMFASAPVDVRLRRRRTRWRNQELDELSTAFRIARETVRTQIAGQVSDARGAGAVGVTLSHSVHRDKLAVASSLQTAGLPRMEPGAPGPPLLRLRPRRRRTPRLGHHHARCRHRRPATPGTVAVPRQTSRSNGSHVSEYEAGSLEGIPESGRERLEQNRQGLYTSDLSVNEFLLVTEAGFDPVGLVVGSSIFHIGFQVAGPTRSRELDVLSQAMYSARHLAMTRMEEEADQLGADGIVGVHLDIGRYEWGANMAEFIAIGTAVKHRDGVLHRAPNGRPFQSDLSGQEFWTLLRTGHRPVGMVMGNCVYHVGRRGPLRTMSQTGRNVELPNYTQALYDARELAMQRMQTEAQELQAAGIVGVTLTEKSHGWGSHVIEFFAIGTAIVATEGGSTVEPPISVLDLNDR